MSTHDLVIENAYLHHRDDVVDIGIDDGRITTIDTDLEDGTETIDADGGLVSPGFVDCHKHIDRAFAATGDRRPAGLDEPFATRGFNELFDGYYEETSLETITERAIENVLMAVEAGTTHVRTHVGADHVIGTDTMTACLRARDRLADVVDLQLVPMAGSGILADGGETALRAAIELGLEHVTDRDAILLGGVDPATRNGDIERTIERWFAVATDYDIDIDVHLQDGGYIGVYTIGRIAEHARRHDYADRVTISHGFSLAQLPDWWLDDVIEAMAAVDFDVVTCFNSIRCSMPIRPLLEGGIDVGHGTDNDYDFVIPHGHADSLDAARLISLKLHGNWRFSEEYRWSESNDALALLWELITSEGAAVLGIEDYGIEEGNPADLVVLDESSPQWAILRQATRTHVIKRGRIVARNGEIVPSIDPLA
ncbi:MAG: amidohydrolase family protein [Halobacteriales archaeon]|nr:amidohydrolase family protein [Halobacteriales archaeon]